MDLRRLAPRERHMSEQILWIESAGDAQKRFRGIVVGWQNSVYTLGQLISSYNELTLNPRDPPVEPMKVLAARRQILSSLLELKTKLDECIGLLNRDGIDCRSVNSLRRINREKLERADSWRAIRNLTFHYGDITEAPNGLVETYHSVGAITDRDVNEVWMAIADLGRGLRDLALNYA